MKKYLKIILPCLLVIIALVFVFSMTYTVGEADYGIIRQFGKVVEIKSEPGLYLKTPFIDEVSYMPKNNRFYDVTPSDVLTSDKKALVIDSYIIWKITDPLAFVQTVATVEEMERRLDASTFSVVKNTMGTMEQSDIIQAGSDTQNNRNALNNLITEKVNEQLHAAYGIDVLQIEVKKLDLPEANEEAVYNRMISDREQIAAAYLAEGDFEASKIRNEADKQSDILISQANAQAETIRGEAEAEYMRILASAYSGEGERAFYEFYRELEAAKAAVTKNGENKKVLILPQNSRLAQIFMSVN